MNNQRNMSIACLLLVFLSASCALSAKDIDRSKLKGKNQLQRTFKQNDLQSNTVSKIQFYTTNYGIFGLNVANNVGGGYWPRNSGNQYIFGGGVWFGAIKQRVVFDSTKGSFDTLYRKMSEISYNPNSGSSWLSPGRIEDGDEVLETPDAISKYRTYISTDFKIDGAPRNAADGPNWAIWDAAPKTDTLSFNAYDKGVSRYFGAFINDVNSRNSDAMPLLDDGKHKGPVVVSNEDFFSTYKDTDLRQWEDGKDVAASRGYPLRLQYEQTVYTWGYGEYANFLFIAYNIINKSNDVLRQCWMAPAYDFDIGPNGGAAIAANDRVNYYSQDTTLNLAFQWTETNNSSEKGKGFGYIGMDFLESPAIDPATHFIRHDKGYYQSNEQLGLQTFRNWIITNDPTSDIARYDFMAAGIREGDAAAGDKRFLMATGPFNMAPGDTARIVIGMIFAPPGKGSEATGDSLDLVELIRRDKFAQAVYDNAFATPKPPDVGPITWKPINNGVIVQWDKTAENSVDKQEKGMDFLGYRLYRARVNNLDTFSVDQTLPNAQYSLGKGPFGWKQIAQWETPKPFRISDVKADSSTTLTPIFPGATIIAKAGYNTLYPGFLTAADVADKSTFLIRRLPNTSINPPSAPWDSFWTPLIPTAAYSNPIKYDTLTLGLIKVRPTGTIPTVTLTDTTSVRNAVNSLYRQVIDSKAQLSWFTDDVENTALFRSEVDKYIDSATNHRTYVDYGDDNGDGVVTTDPDLTKTEKLINNVDYYYRLLAYDEGDYFQRTPIKLNSGVEKVNLQQAFPLGEGAKKDASVANVVYDANELGGLFNFRLVVGDQQRFNQLFGGHKIKLTFKRNTLAFNGVYAPVDSAYDRSTLNLYEGLYTHTMIVTDQTTNDLLGSYTIYYEPRDCITSGLFSECSVVHMSPGVRLYADSIALDTNNFANPFNRDIVTRYGSFSTDRPCNAPDRFINGALGIAFDYSIQQFGGYLRVNGTKRTVGDADVQMSCFKANASPNNLLQRTRINATLGRYETYNNGPGTYEVEFVPGGTETITSKRLRRFIDSSSTPPVPRVDTVDVRFDDVQYLNLRVKNVYSFKRYDPATKDSVVVQYTSELPHNVETLPASIAPSQAGGTPTIQEYPDPQLVPIGSYNLSANGWVNGRYTAANVSDKESSSIGKITSRRYQATEMNTGRPVGSQGRYYLSKIQNGDTLDFTHFFLVDGAEYMLDFAAKGGRTGNLNGRTYDRVYAAADTDKVNPIIPQKDFKVGDKIELSTFGGAFGLPRDNASVVLDISTSDIAVDQSGNQTLTDDDMNRILVVPNPYVITDIGQKSSYDAKIYFTHLPKECTIKVYTINGDLIRTIQHVDVDGSNKQGMDVWDLLSSNRQRAASQGLFAVIESPNGAKTIKKFAVVVGGSRLVK